jgi:hypothetical protein
MWERFKTRFKLLGLIFHKAEAHIAHPLDRLLIIATIPFEFKGWGAYLEVICLIIKENTIFLCGCEQSFFGLEFKFYSVGKGKMN